MNIISLILGSLAIEFTLGLGLRNAELGLIVSIIFSVVLILMFGDE